MGIQVTILGSNSAIPTANRNPTAQIVSVEQEYFLVDCGEGTQTQLRRFGIKFQRISRILISHMHGDHYFGLIGLLNTMHLLSREKEIHIYAPAALEEIILLQLKASNSILRFPVIFHELNRDNVGLIFENKRVKISTTLVSHRIDCFGFIFQEQQRPLQIKKEKVVEFDLQVEEILALKRGESVERENGQVLAVEDCTNKPQEPLKYSFITDTKPTESYYDAIRDSDLLYHEATFLEDQAKRAKETFHSTAQQAAGIALKMNCKRLILGHFSTRYGDLDPILQEARLVFKHTELATEGRVFNV